MSDSGAKGSIIEYNSRNQKKSRNILVIAMVLFLVLFPLPILLFFISRGSFGLLEAILFFFSSGSLFVLYFSYGYYKMNRYRRLVVSSDGILLKAGLSGDLSDHGLTPWSSVERVEVVNSRRSELAELVLYRVMQPAIRMRLTSLDHENLDKLVSSCDLWAMDSAKDSSFIELLDSVTQERRESSDTSFTALWLEEAQRRLSSTPFEPLRPGSYLQSGRVKVVQPLTAGGWSAVYLCTWTDSRAAVLKEAVVPDGAGDEIKRKAYEQFEREAGLLSSLEHPSLARVLDFFVENGRQYMVMTRITGVNLRTYIKDRGAVSARQAINWAIELCRIIEYLHGREPPVVHRDITPENLVLDMKGSLNLIDFGAANEFLGTVTGTLIGKPSYIAPEQYAGKARPESDIYSLGAVLYFMLTAEDPQALSSSNAGKISIPELDELICSMRAVDHASRLSPASLVLERLLALRNTAVGN